MEKIHVDYVIGSLELGGSERQLVELASRLDRDRFEPRIYCLSHPGVLAEAAGRAGVPVHSLGIGSRPLWKWGRWTLALRRLFRESGTDVVHAFLFPSYALAALAAVGLPLKVVAGIRSVGVGREGRWPFSVLDAIGLGLVERVVVNADAVRSSLSRRHPRVTEKTLVIRNGIDPSPYREGLDGAGLRQGLGIPSSAFMVLMVGNLIAYKGHEDAIRALGLLRKRLPNAVLALAGSGPHEARLRALAARLELLDGGVFFLGRRDDVPRLLEASDLVLLASHEEGLPNAVLEAMAAARPVVATRVGGVPELVSHGATGLLVEPGDMEGIEQALYDVATGPALSDRLGAAGRGLVAERFAWAETVRPHERLYSSLVETA